MSDNLKPSLLARCLQRLAGGLYCRPGWFFWPQLILFGVCVWGTAKYLQADMERNNLVGSEKRYHQIYLNFKKEFPGQDDLVAVVESDNPEKNRQFVERLGARLEARTNLFTDIFYKGDLTQLGSKALLFAPLTNLVELKRTLEDYRPFLAKFTQTTNLDSLFAMVNRQFRTAPREASPDNEALARALPSLERLIIRAEEAMQRPGIPPSPGLEALFGGGPEAEREKYITFDHGRTYLVNVKARNAEVVSEAIEKLRDLVALTQAEVPGVNAGVTGEPVLESDEMKQSQHDSTLAAVLSLALVAIIFIVAYREVGRPLKAVACLVIGLGYTMGYTTLVIGHLNILTITFVPMLIGLAIDFGVHLITRYEEELHKGRSSCEAMDKALIFTGQGIFTGCLTTAGAFFAMALTDFKGIQEMGIITGGGLLICLVPMMTMLPVLILREHSRGRIYPARGLTGSNAEQSELHASGLRSRLERLWLDRPWTVMGMTVALCVLAAVRLPAVHFDYNLLHMQSPKLASVIFSKKLIQSKERSVLFAAVVADSAAEAHTLEAKILKLSAVASTDSMGRYLHGDSTNKRLLVKDVKQSIAGLHFAPPDAAPVDLENLNRRLWILQGYLGLAAEEVAKSDNKKLLEELTSLRFAIGRFRTGLTMGDADRTGKQLAHFQVALLNDIREIFSALEKQDDSSGMMIQDLPPALRNRFVGVSGKHLIQVYPKRDIWDRDAQQEFVEQIRTVASNVTGTPVQLFEYTALLVRSYLEAAGWALGAIVILVFIHFRTLTSVVLALLPVFLGTLWMIGFMGWAGIPFNPANVMTLPLVFGIGVTNGIHILNRFAEEKNCDMLSKSTGKAVLVSGLTTIAGFGCLIIAEHQGIRSLGWVMAVGTATCMLAGLTFLPALLAFKAPSKPEKIFSIVESEAAVTPEETF